MDKPDETLPRLKLPPRPPVEPMLAQLTRDMPSGGGWLYAPKANDMDWAPLRPELVCEVAFDQVTGHRIRHGSRFVRWRPDKPAAQCTFEQLVVPPNVDLRKLLA